VLIKSPAIWRGFLFLKNIGLLLIKNNSLITIHPHAAQRAKERGAETNEIITTVETG